MKFSNKLWLSASLLALLSPAAIVNGQESNPEWQARNIEEVRSEIVYRSDNQAEYTIIYGDTLGVIAEALEIDLTMLAEINDIQDVDVIYPDNLIKAKYNDENLVESVVIETPSGETYAYEISDGNVQAVQNNVVATASQNQVIIESIPEWTNPNGNQEQAAGSNANSSVTEEVVAPEAEELIVDGETQLVERTDLAEETVWEVVENPVIEAPAVGELTEEDIANLEEANVGEEVPVVEESPIVEESPEVEEVPVVEEAPVLEEAPVMEEAPVVEETPIEEELPVVEETPIIEEELPVVEVVPVVEEAPVVEEVPVVDPYTNPQNAGLQPHVAAYKEQVAALYGIDSFSLYRSGDGGDHGSGLAVDFMVPVGSQLGDDVANYSINNMGANQISYVIWEQQIYGDWNNQWVWMEDRGSVTANHYDHVHVSFYE